tara:strand:+ start:1840 stop:2439 length:600 start_codon:yes stop_codon:yes gene_type:complete
MLKIKFIFDVASPNGYLSHKVVPAFEKKYNVQFDYKICLLGGIHKLSNNQSPIISYAEIPNKSSYFNKEIERFIKFHNLEKFQMNPHFPINTLQIQRAALVAQELGVLKEYIDVVCKGMWEEGMNFGDQLILTEYLNNNNLDGTLILNQSSEPHIKQKLIENTESAVEMGAFGVPTFFIENEIFWGKEAFREMPDYLSN